MTWEIVIGLETHAQLSTASKIFSASSTAFGAAPNTQASAVDIALPGVLPVLNKGAVERAVRFGLSIGATINPRSVFARKNYFYPDLPKGYQISQYEIPVVQGGTLAIVSPTRGELRVRITRAHLEEDAGKSLHEDFHGMTGIDLNRAGTPLLEIVSEPDLRSSAEAVVYARALHSLVRWIGICDGNMQEGSFRCDANVSVRRAGATELGTRCEIKNLNSFRFMQHAIDFEARRQVELIEEGGRVVQETRLYDPERSETRPMRSKEDAQDYRYFPDPDLPPLVIAADWIEAIRAALPELPEAMRLRFVAHGVSAYDATILTSELELARFYEATVDALGGEHKLVANWVINELMAALHRSGIEIAHSPVTPRSLAAILQVLRSGRVHASGAKVLFQEIWERGAGLVAGAAIAQRLSEFDDSIGATIEGVIEARGLRQITDESALEGIVDRVLAENRAVVAEYEAGKEKAFNALVGKTMQATRGKANPAQVNAILKRKLRAPEDA